MYLAALDNSETFGSVWGVVLTLLTGRLTIGTTVSGMMRWGDVFRDCYKRILTHSFWSVHLIVSSRGGVVRIEWDMRDDSKHESGERKEEGRYGAEGGCDPCAAAINSIHQCRSIRQRYHWTDWLETASEMPGDGYLCTAHGQVQSQLKIFCK